VGYVRHITKNQVTRHQPPFTASQLEALAKALGHTDEGLSGSEIGQILAQAGIGDHNPAATKWIRVFDALATRQNRDKSADFVLTFVNLALSPARYVGRSEVFERRRRNANTALAFYGLEYTMEGKFRRCTAATTLDEAESRADALRAKLRGRDVEEEVLAFCRAEMLRDNYFHAVQEATKSVAAKIRERTGLTSDGADLVQQAFGGQAPKLRVNALRTDTEKGEQRGFVNLLVGMFGTFRNPTAHAARIEWPMPERDALDLLSLASYALRRVKSAAVV
jgi:uncharacterized protein (TIGR02391 family)